LSAEGHSHQATITTLEGTTFDECGGSADIGTHEYTVWIDASPEKVFDIYADVNRLPEWEVGIREVKDVTGPGDRVGTTYAVRYGPFSSRSEVVEAKRPRRLVTRTSGVFGLRGLGTSNLTPEGRGTRLDILYETVWPYRWLGVLEKAMFNPGTLERELDNLKALVEREARGGGRL
jgi:uncharacterized protein YndB with AHSA1/START domain